MPIDLDELERLAKAATPGPRTYDPEGQIVWGPNGEHIADMRGVGAGLPVDANGKFIAASDPQTMLALLDRLRELEKERAGLRAMIDRLAADCIRLEKRVPEGGGRTTGGGHD